MSHCCFSFDLRFLIIPLLSFPHCVVCFLYYYSSKKKKKHGENDVTSGYDVTSGHVTDVTSGHVTRHFRSLDWRHFRSRDVLFGDVTFGSTPFPNYDGLQILKTVEVLIRPHYMRLPQYSQSNDEEHYYILKTNNPFFCFGNLNTVMYFM